jgi:hypothetical protein
MAGADAEYPELDAPFKEVTESILTIGSLKSISSLLMVSKEVGYLKDDYFGLFGSIKEVTSKYLVSCKPGDKIFDNYSCDIAAYAWDNKKWLKTLYKIFKGTSLFDYVYLFMINMLNTINCLNECKNTASRSIETKTSDSQLPRPSLSKVRDQIESALAFINIRDADNHYFDPNLDETENFEDRLLALSNEINKCMEKYLKPGVYDTQFTFKSRLMSDEEEAGGLVETIGLLRKAIGGQEDIINLKFEDA